MGDWNSYIDSTIGASQDECEKVTIVGKDQGNDWVAKTDKVLGLEDSERAELANVFKQNGPPTNGVHIEKAKYIYLRSVDNAHIFRKGNVTLVIAASKLAIIIGRSKGDGNAASVLNGVKQTADYLVQNNF